MPKLVEGLHEELNQSDKDNKQSNPASELEMKIFRAAGYDADKVKAIRELMEEEAIGVINHMKVSGLHYSIVTDANELYKDYQQNKATT